MPHDDATLVAKLRLGDTNAFADMVRMYYAKLYASAFSYVQSQATAEDIVDRIFEKVWDNRETLVIHRTLAAYLFAAVRNTVINRAERDRYADERQRLANASDEPVGMGKGEPRPDVRAEQQSVQDVVWHIIDQLPERVRAILWLRWREQLEWDEIAHAMGMTLAAVQMQHSRALRILRDRLDGVQEQ